jgi:hypothetical protein
MTQSFTIGSDRFTRIGAATYNGLPKIFWQHWVHHGHAWVLNGTKCIHPDADADEVFDVFIGAPCEY